MLATPGRPTIRSAALALGALLSAPPALAQSSQPPPPSITQTVIVTATAAPLPAESASRAVTIITRDELDRLGLISFADALRLAPGVDVRARGPLDVQTDVSIRGATFGQSLVLVDGMRINDSQSGHHNGEIPISLPATDRIEIVNGPASAVHGADALGGTINVITRQDAHAVGSFSAGQHGYVSGQASASGFGVPAGWVVTGWGNRSAGFMFDRDFARGGAAVRGRPVRGVLVDLRHERRAFGANGFYGASPSKEWTNQTLAAAAYSALAGPWLTELRGVYRHHRDHFRWDINRPGFAENRHRTHATDVTLTARRDFGVGRRLTLGSGGGRDTIVSNNLGDHGYSRVSAFGEVQLPVRASALVQAGVRYDGYSRFGRAWSPSVSASAWITGRLRVRGSAGRAFRVPTFTELYYRDPNHQGSGALESEDGWSVDGAADWTAGGWTVSLSPFARWDSNVIDWVRASDAERWQTTNVRDVTTRGLELSGSRRWREARIRVSVTALDVDAPALDQLSKYVLEYARRSMTISAATPLGRGFRAAVTVDHRNRVDGQSYALVHARLTRAVGRVDFFLDATNLFDVEYAEIPGVATPGRWVTAGITIR